MSEFSILKGKKIVPASMTEWSQWHSKIENRQVASDQIEDVRISTVCLGMNHSFGTGPPLWFETMIFGGDHDQYTDRYETYEEAEEGHKKALALVDKNGDKD